MPYTIVFPIAQPVYCFPAAQAPSKVWLSRPRNLNVTIVKLTNV